MQNTDYNPHYITSAEEQYNHLVMYIVDSWKSVNPDSDPRYCQLLDMIDDMAKKAREGIALRDRLAQSANDDINQSFADMRGMMAALERATGK